MVVGHPSLKKGLVDNFRIRKNRSEPRNKPKLTIIDVIMRRDTLS